MPSITPNYFRQLLLKELERRQVKNAAYSRRSFARDLGLDIASLSRVLAGKGNLSVSSGRKIAKALKLSAEEGKLLLESIAEGRKAASLQNAIPNSTVTDEIKLVEQDQFEIISNLYHYAILELAQTDGFDSRPQKIAKALGINAIEAEQAIARLLRLGLLQKIDSKLVKTSAYLTTKDKTKTSRALKNHQREIMENALYRLDNEPIEKRIFSGMTIPVDPARLPMARELIDEFTKKMASIMSAGEKKSVYQLQVSFCSLMAREKLQPGVV